MAKKRRKLKRRLYQPKSFFLYINSDGSQHIPENQSLFEESIESISDEVDEFYFTIKVLPASFGMRSSSSMTKMMINAQLDPMTQQTGKISEDEATESERLVIEELTQAIGEWNLEDEEGNPIPVTLQTLVDLTPGWLLSCIKSAHNKVNSAKNLTSV